MAIARKKLLLDIDLDAMIEAKVRAILSSSTTSIVTFPDLSRAQRLTGTAILNNTYTRFDVPGAGWVYFYGHCAVYCYLSYSLLTTANDINACKVVVHNLANSDGYSDASALIPVTKKCYLYHTGSRPLQTSATYFPFISI